MKNIFYVICLFLLMSCYKKPTASFSWGPQNPKAGDLVTFSNSSTNGKKYDWNLGNMKISSEVEPVCVYDQAGEYVVDLTAYNGTKSDKTTQTITIIP